jgi:hypothetical protein
MGAARRQEGNRGLGRGTKIKAKKNKIVDQ